MVLKVDNFSFVYSYFKTIAVIEMHVIILSVSVDIVRLPCGICNRIILWMNVNLVFVCFIINPSSPILSP